MKKVNYEAIKDALRNRESFHGNTMWGDWLTPGEARVTAQVKDMAEADVAYMTLLAERYGRVFVVHSYETPIAFAAGDTRRIPDRYYSTTTSKHQNLCRKYL